MFDDLPPAPDFEWNAQSLGKLIPLAAEYVAANAKNRAASAAGFIAFTRARLSEDEIDQWERQLKHTADRVERDLRSLQGLN